MGSFSDYLENKLLDHVVGKTSFTMPASVYVALILNASPPTDASTGTTISEPSGNNYARKLTAGSDWNAAASGSSSNANDIVFNQASGSWGVVGYFALVDASTNGNVLAWGALTATKTIDSGDTPKFAAGSLTITLD